MKVETGCEVICRNPRTGKTSCGLVNEVLELGIKMVIERTWVVRVPFKDIICVSKSAADVERIAVSGPL